MVDCKTVFVGYAEALGKNAIAFTYIYSTIYTTTSLQISQEITCKHAPCRTRPHRCRFRNIVLPIIPGYGQGHPFDNTLRISECRQYSLNPYTTNTQNSQPLKPHQTLKLFPLGTSKTRQGRDNREMSLTAPITASGRP